MKFNFFVSLKYFRSKKPNQFISRISLISICTVALAILVPTLVLSVMNGFHSNVTNKIIGTNYHIKMVEPNDNFENYKQIHQELASDGDIQFIAPYFESQGLLRSSEGIMGVMIKAITEDEYTNNKYFRENYKTVEGYTFDDIPIMNDFKIPLENGVMVGENIGKSLNLYPGDHIELMIPRSEVDIAQGNLKVLPYCGKYSAGYAEYDKNLIIMRYEPARRIFGFKDIASGLGIILNNVDNIKDFIDKLKERYPKYKFINTLEYTIFKDFKKEKDLMKWVLYFLVLAAFMTIYITIHVIVIDKRKEIGIMKAFGVHNNNILLIFVIQGFWIGVVGSLIGIIFGLMLILSLTDLVHLIEWFVNFLRPLINSVSTIISKTEVIKDTFEIMPKRVFYMQSFPYQLMFADLLFTCIGAILVSILAAYFPARRTTLQKPSEVLRYE